MNMDIEVQWPLNARHARLPKWAQDQIAELLIDRINQEMSDCLQGNIRRSAKRALGGCCTFADDDLHLLTLLAEAAIDANLHLEITDKCTLANIEKAKERRAIERLAARAIEA